MNTIEYLLNHALLQMFLSIICLNDLQSFLLPKPFCSFFFLLYVNLACFDFRISRLCYSLPIVGLLTSFLFNHSCISSLFHSSYTSFLVIIIIFLLSEIPIISFFESGFGYGFSLSLNYTIFFILLLEMILFIGNYWFYVKFILTFSSKNSLHSYLNILGWKFDSICFFHIFFNLLILCFVSFCIDRDSSSSLLSLHSNLSY